MIKSYLQGDDIENVYDRVLERLCGEFWKRNDILLSILSWLRSCMTELQLVWEQVEAEAS